MKQVFFIHGGESFSDYNSFLCHLQNKEIRDLPTIETFVTWPRSLSEKLGDTFSVYMPHMPNSENARYIEWKIWFERYFEYLGKEIILIGWSLGALFCLKYLSENVPLIKIKALFLVASPFDNFIDPKTGEDGGDFNFDTHELERLEKHAGQIHIFHSKDDFVVPYDQALKLNAALRTSKLHTFEHRNHFLQAEFPELIAEIEKIEQ